MINQIYLSGRVNKKSLKENKSQYHSHRESKNRDVNCTRIWYLKEPRNKDVSRCRCCLLKVKPVFNPQF